MRSTTSTTRLAVALSLLLLTGLIQRAGAECRVLSPQMGGGAIEATPTAPLGQSFVACADGIITNFSVHPSISTQSLVVVGFQRGTDLLAPQYQVTMTLPPPGGRLQLTPNFPVIAGETYSFSFTPISGILRFALIHPSYFNGGTMLQVRNGVTVPLDGFMYFSIIVNDPPVPAIPSTWGAIKSTYH